VQVRARRQRKECIEKAYEMLMPLAREDQPQGALIGHGTAPSPCTAQTISAESSRKHRIPLDTKKSCGIF
jgi:hypothetical protein